MAAGDTALAILQRGLAHTTEAEIPAGVDISSWVCKYCEFEQGLSGEVEGGVGYVSNNSFKFGEYNGLNDNGAYPVGYATIPAMKMPITSICGSGPL